MRTLMTIVAMLLWGAQWAGGQDAQSCGFSHPNDTGGLYTSSTDSETCSHGGGGITPDQGQNFIPAGFEPLVNQNAVLSRDYLNGARPLFSGEGLSLVAVNSAQPDQVKRAANTFREISRKHSKALPTASRASLADRPDLANVTFLVLPSRTLGPIVLQISHPVPAHSFIGKCNREISCVADDSQKWWYA